MKLPFQIDLSGKVAVVTGAGGVLCSEMAKALAACGAKVALVGRTLANVATVADEITAEGGIARPYQANVLDRAGVEAAAEQIHKDFGLCDILVNGAGGNNARANTDKEYYERGDIDADVKTFFDLDDESIQFVFNLNFVGTLTPTQVFAKDML